MTYQNPSIFSGNVYWKHAKQLKTSDFYNMSHNAAVTANLFQILDMLTEIDLEYTINCYPQYLYGPSKSIDLF